MKSPAWCGIAAVAFLVVFAGGCNREDASPPALVCHVGGTMRPAMLELAKMYEAETGQPVEINCAGSGELLAYIELQNKGDLYVCHDPFLDLLMTKFRMGVDGWTVAELRPVIVVAKGNPKDIEGLKDFARPEVRLALTDFRHSTLGWMLPTLFAKAGMDLGQVARDKHVAINKSGGYVANLVVTGNADAAMVWNAVAHLRDNALDAIPLPAEHLPIPGVDAVTSATGRTYTLAPVRVTIATLSCSKQAKAARRFAEFAASDRASKVFEGFGFTGCKSVKEYEGGKAFAAGKVPPQVGPGDVTLRIYAGAGLRPALDELIAAFTAESGMGVEPDYGGSGLIISRARQDPEADLFMPGDVWYVDRLQELSGLIEAKTPVSWFVPVMIVRKGNPKGIKRLADFFREDVSVALGRADACQVGRRISDKILRLNGLDRRNLRCKESLTVNELGVWVKMGSVDTAIVWDAIAANIADSVDMIAIPQEKNVISHVVVGLMTPSRHKVEARRFIDFMLSDAGREILRRKGYCTEAP